MREIRTSGSMSGEGKRSDATWPKPPRPSSTLLRAIVESPKSSKIGGTEPPPLELMLARMGAKKVLAPACLVMRPACYLHFG